jgi:hypothetical protein
MGAVKNNGWPRFALKHDRMAGKFRLMWRQVVGAPYIRLDATVLVPCFLLFLCFRKVTQEIFS